MMTGMMTEVRYPRSSELLASLSCTFGLTGPTKWVRLNVWFKPASALPVLRAGQTSASGAGGRYPSDECGRIVL